MASSRMNWILDNMSKEFKELRDVKSANELLNAKLNGKNSSSFDISGKESMERIRKINSDKVK